VTSIDYAHTRTAEQNRLAKAEALAAAARELDVDANGLAVGTGNRRRVWKAAGLKRAPSEDSWMAVVDLLGLPPVAGRALGPAVTGSCLFHPDRPGRLYLGGHRCAECSPAALAGRTRPVPPPGTTAADRLAARAGAAVVDAEPPWVTAAKKRDRSAAGRARLATRVYQRGLHHPGPPP